MNLTNSTGDDSQLGLSLDQILKIAYFSLVAILTILINSLAVFIFSRLKHKTYTNILYLTIAVSDLLSGLVQVPIILLSQLNSDWNYGNIVCYVKLSVAGTTFCISIYMLLVLAIERCVQIIKPSKISDKVSARKVFVIILVWVVGISLKLFRFIGHYLTHNIDTSVCRITLSFTYVLVDSVATELVPTTLTVLVNLANIGLIFGKRKRVFPATVHFSTENTVISIHRRHSCRQLSGTHAAPANPQPPPEANRARKERVQKSKFDKQKRAVICIGALIANTILTNYFFLIAYPLFYLKISATESAFNSSFYVLVLFPLFNPILILMFHDSFRIELITKLKAKLCSSE